MAHSLQREHGLAHLDLDSIAWSEPGVRLPMSESQIALEAFIQSHEQWVIEGSYASLAIAATAFCNELRFLNPGVAACVANCEQRPWEPEKYASQEQQNERLGFLLDWVRQYETRDDEYGLVAHQAVYDSFQGKKQIYTSNDEGLA